MTRCTLLFSIGLLVVGASRAYAQPDAAEGRAEAEAAPATPAVEGAEIGAQEKGPAGEPPPVEADGQGEPSDADEARGEPPPVEADGQGEPSDADKARAREHFRMGVEFYRERNFRAALIEFQRAYRTAPHYKLLYNLGQASVELQEYANAIDYLASFLRAGGDAIEAGLRSEVAKLIDDLQARIATVTIDAEDGAEVFVDDTSVGRAPLDRPVRVGAGRRRFSAELAGHERVEQVRDVAAGDHLTVRLAFGSSEQNPSEAETPVRAPPPVASPDAGWPASTWALLATGTLAAASGTLAVLSALAAKDYEDERRVETTKASLDGLREDAQRKAVATDILLAATLASGVVTTILLLSEAGGGDAEHADAGLRLELGLGHARVTGAF